MNEKTSRIDAEWIALNAFRELTKIASKGDPAKSTYDNALDLGGELYPELLGPEKSVRLPDDNVLRVRVLHPDKPEHISGADIIYERHSPNEEGASIVAVQYKIGKARPFTYQILE